MYAKHIFTAAAESLLKSDWIMPSKAQIPAAAWQEARTLTDLGVLPSTSKVQA